MKHEIFNSTKPITFADTASQAELLILQNIYDRGIDLNDWQLTQLIGSWRGCGRSTLAYIIIATNALSSMETIVSSETILRHDRANQIKPNRLLLASFANFIESYYKNDFKVTINENEVILETL